MLFLYSDDGSHFRHNKLPHKMTYDLVSVQGWPINTGKITKKDKHGTATGWPPNTGNKYNVCMSEKSGL